MTGPSSARRVFLLFHNNATMIVVCGAAALLIRIREIKRPLMHALIHFTIVLGQKKICMGSNNWIASTSLIIRRKFL